APQISLPSLMEMQLKLATEALKSVTDQQFDFLRSNLGTKEPSNHQNGSSLDSRSHSAGINSSLELHPAGTTVAGIEHPQRQNPLKCGEYQVLLREYPSETDLTAAKLTIAEE